MGGREEGGSQDAPLTCPAIFVPWRKSLAESLPVDGVVAHACNPSIQEVEYEASLGYTAIPCLRKQIMGWRDVPRSRVLAALQEHLSLALGTYVRKFMTVYNFSSRGSPALCDLYGYLHTYARHSGTNTHKNKNKSIESGPLKC